MFGTSGIRGEVGTAVTAALAFDVGRALASEGYGRVLVGRDARASGQSLAASVRAGLRGCGADAVRAGVVTTPTLARGVCWADAEAGVMITASHNPPEVNGLKLWTADGRSFDRAQRRAIASRIREERFAPADWQHHGAEADAPDLQRRHREEIVFTTDVAESLSVVVDAGNGPGSFTATALRGLGCEVTTLNADHDGTFPGRPSEPTAETCTDLQQYVATSDADLGIAHDGDADRMMAVTATGKFVDGDALLALFARREASTGDVVVAPLNTSMGVDQTLTAAGASVSRTRVGDGYVAERAEKEDAVFGGEPSGAWIWPAETLSPDGPLAACRLAELVSDEGPLDELLDGLEACPTRRTSIEARRKSALVERVATDVHEAYEDVTTTDGVRVDTGDGWFLVRASGTQPLVRVTAEATSERRADRLFDHACEFVDHTRGAVEASSERETVKSGASNAERESKSEKAGSDTA